MQTDSTKQFHTDYLALRRMLVTEGTSATSDVKRFRMWVRLRGSIVLKDLLKELHSDKMVKKFKRQSAFEQEELAIIHEKDGYDGIFEDE